LAPIFGKFYDETFINLMVQFGRLQTPTREFLISFADGIKKFFILCQVQNDSFGDQQCFIDISGNYAF
jgi:hypothetical protein